MTRTSTCAECGAPFERPAGPGNRRYCPEHSGRNATVRRYDHAARKRRVVPTQALTRREALLLRELAMIPGQPVDWTILAEAVGENIEDPRGKARMESVIQNIRRKFGRDAIQHMAHQGYYVQPEARRTG